LATCTSSTEQSNERTCPYKKVELRLFKKTQDNMRVQASKYKVTACMHKHPNKIGMRAQHLLNKATLLGITFLKLLWWPADDRTHARLVHMRNCGRTYRLLEPKSHTLSQAF
jgi:hypothetical protein